MESGPVLSHTKQKKQHRAATCRSWQKLSRLLITETIPAPEKSADTHGLS